MNTVKIVLRFCLCMALFFLSLRAGLAQSEKQKSIAFHRFDLPGSPTTGNSIAVDEQGLVYFQTMRYIWPDQLEGQSWDGGYLVYKPDGDIVGEFWGGAHAFHYNDINVMNDRIYLYSSAGSSVFVLDSKGETLARIQVPPSASLSGAPDNTFWVANLKDKSVDHYDEFGNQIGSVPSQQTARVRVSPKDGRVYIATHGVGIEVYSPDGKKEGEISGWPLYNCTWDGNVLAGFTVYSPDGVRLRDIQLKDMTYKVHDAAIGPKGNVYLAVKDPLNTIGFVAYDEFGNFRYIRGADFDEVEVMLPSQVLKPDKAYNIPVTFETSYDKGYLAAGQVSAQEKRQVPALKAFLKDMSSGGWFEVNFSAEKPGSYILKLSEDVPIGRYTLRITSGEEAEAVPGSPKPLQCDFVVTVTKGGGSDIW